VRQKAGAAHSGTRRGLAGIALFWPYRALIIPWISCRAKGTLQFDKTGDAAHIATGQVRSQMQGRLAKMIALGRLYAEPRKR